MERQSGAPIEPKITREVSLVPNYASFFGESLMPPSDEGKRMTLDEFKTQYPVRYDIWKVLSQRLLGHNLDGNLDLSDQEMIDKQKTRLNILNQLDRYTTAHYSGERGQILRERQMRVFEDIHDYLEKGNMEGFVHAPTGFGKTIMFGQVVAALDTTTTIVVPRKRLVEQTYNSIRERNPYLDIGRVYGDKKEYGRKITITTYESLALNSESEDEIQNRKRTNLVIFDEMHRATTESRINAGEAFQNAIMLGFSATPVEVTAKNVSDKRIAQMTKKLIHDIPYREAVEEGAIAPFSAYIVEVDRDISNVRITASGNYDEKDLEQVLDEESANQAAVNFFLEMKKLDIQTQRNAKRRRIEPFSTAVFASSVAHAQHLAQRFQEAGIKAATVWGNQNRKEQEDIFQRFEKGEIEVLCSDKLIREGTDIPRIRFIENVAPTSSAVEEQQRSGRGSRDYPIYPEKHLIIADFLYTNSNRRGQQITFPQVVDGARMVRGNINGGSNVYGGGGVYTPEIHIEGLRVVTNPEEVMTIVKNLQNTEFLDLQETDFSIASRTFTNTFQGDYKEGQRLRRIADEVITKLKEDHPSMFDRRKRGIKVFTNKNLLIQKMLKAGAELRIKDVQGLQPNEFGITPSSFMEVFQGTYQNDEKLRKIADEVMTKLRNEHPDKFEKRKSGKLTIDAFTDKVLLIQEMLKSGAQLKKLENRDLEEVKPNEFGITAPSFEDTFQGDYSENHKLKQIADEVMTRLRKERPDMFIRRKRGFRPIEVFIDETLLVQEMLKAGAQLKIKDEKGLQANEFRLSGLSFRETFQGSFHEGEKLRQIADEIMTRLRNEHPDMFEVRKNGSVTLPVFADKDLLIREMIKAGAKLKRQ